MNRQCFLQVDENGRELQPHGSKPFPCTCYSSSINHGNVPWHWHEDIEIHMLQKDVSRERLAANASFSHKEMLFL